MSFENFRNRITNKMLWCCCKSKSKLSNTTGHGPIGGLGISLNSSSNRITVIIRNILKR